MYISLPLESGNFGIVIRKTIGERVQVMRDVNKFEEVLNGLGSYIPCLTIEENVSLHYIK